MKAKELAESSRSKSKTATPSLYPTSARPLTLYFSMVNPQPMLGYKWIALTDNGYNTEHTIHDGYDHLGEIVRRETVHHPLLEVEPRRFNLQMLAYHGLDGIYATREEAETHLKN